MEEIGLEPSIQERKRQMRRSIRELFGERSGLETEMRMSHESQLQDRLRSFAQEHWTPESRVWAFWPTLPEEPDFRLLVAGMMQQGMCIGLPRLDWDRRKLHFHVVTDPATELEFDSRGLAQPLADLPIIGPDEVTMIICPGLAFDRQGGRLGRGAGFYDRTLAEVPAEVPRWGIGFEFQLVERVPMDSWDQRVHGVILPAGPIRCSGPA